LNLSDQKTENRKPSSLAFPDSGISLNLIY
jgi:hypothetical protein